MTATEPTPEATPTPLLLPPPPVARRVLALTEAGVAVPPAFARLVDALRVAGAEVLPLAMPRSASPDEAIPTLTDFKRGLTTFAKDLMRGFRSGPGANPESWLASQLRAVEGRVDAVLALDPAVARAAFPEAERAWPGCVRVAIDGDYHLDPEWRGVELDALVVAHAGLGADVSRIVQGRARAHIGGPLAIGDKATARRLDPALPQVVVSLARVEPGDVDSLLFQLSLAHPERFALLFLPSQRDGVDELVRVRAGHYGLRGKRPKLDGGATDVASWIHGAALLVGHPAPSELAEAALARVPVLVFARESQLDDGDRFLIRRGAAVHADVPITIAVHVEGLLPGGPERLRAEAALAELETTGVSGAAQAVMLAIAAGRAAPAEPTANTAAGANKIDDGLEDIGWAPPAGGGLAPSVDVPLAMRRAYLKEIILQQQLVEQQLARAKGGLETWQKRVRLARTAGLDPLADRAVPRVDGLLRLVDRLTIEARQLHALRDRFASQAPISAEDRAAAARFLKPETAASLDRNELADSAFVRLELDDALASLKRKLNELK